MILRVLTQMTGRRAVPLPEEGNRVGVLVHLSGELESKSRFTSRYTECLQMGMSSR